MKKVYTAPDAAWVRFICRDVLTDSEPEREVVLEDDELPEE